jgi:FkbM family methyltransferase
MFPMPLREYIQHQLIGTPLYPIATMLRHVRARCAVRDPAVRALGAEDGMIRNILRKSLRPGDNCIDIGAHLGAVTSTFVRRAPAARHMAFEPTPYKAAWLRKKFPTVEVVEAALSDETGEAVFYHQRRNSGYSGLARHEAGVNDATAVDEVHVKLCQLDDLVPGDRSIRLIKIDVEGAELKVCRGARALLERDHPTVIFESTHSALKAFGATPQSLYEFFRSLDYNVYVPADFLNERGSLSEGDFCRAHDYPFRAFNFVADTERYVTSSTSTRDSDGPACTNL